MPVHIDGTSCGPHRGVGNDDHVAGEPGPLARQQRGEIRRARLFLALDQQLERDRRRARPARRAGPRGQGVEQHLALVVGGPAPQQLPVALHRHERRRIPFLQRLDRLHVVMAVHQHHRGRRVRRRPVREHRGQPAAVLPCLPDLRLREAGLAQVRQPATARRPRTSARCPGSAEIDGMASHSMSVTEKAGAHSRRCRRERPCSSPCGCWRAPGHRRIREVEMPKMPKTLTWTLPRPAALSGTGNGDMRRDATTALARGEKCVGNRRPRPRWPVWHR